MPKVSKVFIEQLYKRYEGVKYSKEIYELHGSAKNTSLDKLFMTARRKHLNKFYVFMGQSLRRKENIDRMYELVKKDTLDPDEQKELEEKYNLIINELSKKRDAQSANSYEAFHARLYNEGYDALAYEDLQEFSKELKVYEDAKRLLNYTKCAKKIKDAQAKYSDCVSRDQELDNEIKEFKTKYAGVDIAGVIKKEDELLGRIAELEEKAKDQSLVEAKEKIVAETKAKVADLEKLLKGIKEIAGQAKAVDAVKNELENKANNYSKLTEELKQQEVKLQQLTGTDAEIMEKYRAYSEKVVLQQELVEIRQKLSEFVDKHKEDGMDAVEQEENVKAFLKKCGIENIAEIDSPELVDKLEKNLQDAKDAFGEYGLTKEQVVKCEDLAVQTEAQQKLVDFTKNALSQTEKEADEIAKKLKDENEKLDLLCTKEGTARDVAEKQVLMFENKIEEIKEAAEKQIAEIDEKIKADVVQKGKYKEEIDSIKAEIKKNEDVTSDARDLRKKEEALRNDFIEVQAESKNAYNQARFELAESADVMRKASIDVRNHTNSQEYKDMLDAIVMVRQTKEFDKKMEHLETLRKKAQDYIEAKNKQFRPFPSVTRKARLEYAQRLIEYVDNTKEAVDIVNRGLATELYTAIEELEYNKLKSAEEFYNGLTTPEKTVEKLPENKEEIKKEEVTEVKEDKTAETEQIIEENSEEIDEVQTI